MGYKNKAKQINKEKKEGREPIVRSEQGTEYAGWGTHAPLNRQNELTQSNKLFKELHGKFYTMEELEELNNELPKKGWRLVKKVKK
tara:strand:+ start:722 stop:979 length:258 start_codon:yes stop_codon:yes gene_type:complete